MLALNSYGALIEAPSEASAPSVLFDESEAQKVSLMENVVKVTLMAGMIGLLAYALDEVLGKKK